MQKKSIRALLETSFLFGLLCWLYVIAMQIARPESVYWPLSIWFRIRLDYFAEISFVVAVISFFLLRYLFDEKRVEY